MTPLRLAAVPDDSAAEVVSGTSAVTVSGKRIPLEVTVPAGPTRLRELLPVLHGLAHAVIDSGVAAVEAEGKSISCRAGCGACCRQLVPVSESEAFALKRLVDAMPDPRRAAVVARFDTAIHRFKETGLLKRLRGHSSSAEERKQLGLDYFALGVPCPFLEDESCSIHPDRPLACREYLVTSSAENCSRPDPASIRRVPIPADVSAVARTIDRATSGSPGGWVPLTLTLDYAAGHAEPPPALTGPELLQAVMQGVANVS
jgi:Fe-S-cluster containining protein